MFRPQNNENVREGRKQIYQLELRNNLCIAYILFIEITQDEVTDSTYYHSNSFPSRRGGGGTVALCLIIIRNERYHITRIDNSRAEIVQVSDLEITGVLSLQQQRRCCIHPPNTVKESKKEEEEMREK